ncbi:monovalent cation/H(+) antiporter subunit G [Gillisia hiemivivida]|jgi:multicomponent Na+:H+ antiporter subunit G|uniref:Monovalent cation/H(+) antiporter subunit G n=1 Tax=Gillisia hiemivivida TaxID=291190 RepID=A0A5C6ZRU6_9FLAO|nr:monovalent cation/H(+) antiporter subunit G [Gillisia hiemivivida]TXD92423.1 monovalent cation/H(+) antiporter subunit G [Gillisia hiemivivida]
MTEIISAIIIIVGVLFVVIGSVGLLRLPDFYIRISAITKAATMGVACIMIGVALNFNEISVAIKAFGVVLFLLITSPIAAHIIGRAAYDGGVPLWKKTEINEYEEYKKNKLKKENNKDSQPNKKEE